MGGGGSSDATTTGITRVPRLEIPQIGDFNKFLFQGPDSQFEQFSQGQPLVKSAEGGAQTFFNQFLQGMPNVWNPSPEEQRTWQQQSRAAGAAQGTARDVGAVGREVMAQEEGKFQRAGQLQGLQTGALNQLLGVEGAKTGAYTALQNPVLGYLGNLFSGNQQAAISQNQIAAQQSAAGKAGTSSAVGGGLAAIGSIAAVAL